MYRFLTLVAVAGLLTAVGCSVPNQVGPEQFKQSIEWTAEYPELVEPLHEAIKDDKYDEEEFKSFAGKYHTLVNQTHMGKIRGKLATIKAEATKNEYKELLAKTREAAAAQGLVVKETADGGIELVVNQDASNVTEEETTDKVVTVESVKGLDSKKLDKALEKALNLPNIVEDVD